MLKHGERPGDEGVRRRGDQGARGPAARCSKTSSRSCSSRATRTTTRTSSSRSAAGAGGDEAAIFAGDLYRMYTRYAELQKWKVEEIDSSRERLGRLQGSLVPHPRRQGLLEDEVRVRRAPRAARAGHRGAGPHPHLDRDRRRAARGRGRRDRDQPERPAHRRLPLERPGRPVGQHDRLGGAHHAPAHRRRRAVAEPEVAAPEPRGGDARAARPPLRVRAREAAGRARRSAPQPDRLGRPLGEDPHLQLPPGPRSPITASA